jgi:hypothetical protein
MGDIGQVGSSDGVWCGHAWNDDILLCILNTIIIIKRQYLTF